MDRLRFVFSLLLIVSVTTSTFGSPIKANNPNGEKLGALRSHLNKYTEMAPNSKEVEALLKRLNPRLKNDAEDKLKEQKDLEHSEVKDHEKSKRKVDAGALIPDEDLTSGLLKKNGANKNRKVVITLGNKSGYAWQSPTVYFVWGEAGDRPLVDPLDNEKSMVYHANSKSMDEGISGVLTYYLPLINSTLAVTFSLPFDSSSFQNLWNVQLNSGNGKTNCEKFLDGYFTDPFQTGDPPAQDLSNGLEFDGSLAVTSDEDILIIWVQPAKKN